MSATVLKERPKASSAPVVAPQPTVKFQTSAEEMNIPGTPLDKEQESALMLNPNASLTVVVAAARARIQTLVCSIHTWRCVHGEQDFITIDEVLAQMEPFAEEVEMLLDSVAARLKADS